MTTKEIESTKIKRGEYLQSVIRKYRTTEPILSYDEIAFLIMEFEDADKFIKAFKKEAKSKY
jgi:hypothetical protein